MSSIQKTARVAGFLYLLLLPLGIFGLLLPSSLILPGDIAGTINNIMASESLFRLGIMSAPLHNSSTYSWCWPYISYSTQSTKTMLP